MKTISLVGCGKNKLSVKSAAKDLYVGELFKKSRKYSEMRHNEFYILSALHGLINPETQIEPYNYTLNDLTNLEIVEWSKKVYEQITTIIEGGEEVEIFVYAGDKYRKHLLPLLNAGGIKTSIPMKGLGIGQQLAWLKNNIGE